MVDVQESVSVPPASSTLANSLAKLALDCVAAKNQGLTGAALVAAVGEAAIADLAGDLAALGGVGGEVSAEPLGVAEAFAVAGFQVARGLTGK